MPSEHHITRRGPAYPSPRELAAILGLRGGPVPLRDRSPDPGLFGPDSLTWRISREPALILGGAAALLAQSAHPLVAQGAIDWSAYRTDPFGRLLRTLRWVVTVSYGTTAEAHEACAQLNRVHGRIHGTLPPEHATPPRLPAGTPYVANDPRLATWVHATFLDGMIRAYEALVEPLTTAERDRLVREWDAVGSLMHVPEDQLWPDHAALQRHIDHEVRFGAVTVGEGSRKVADTILNGPLGNPVLRPLRDALLITGVGILHPALRERYGIRWGRLEQASFDAFTAAMRLARRMPWFPRETPAHRFATRRVQRRLRRPEQRQVA